MTAVTLLAFTLATVGAGLTSAAGAPTKSGAASKDLNIAAEYLPLSLNPALNGYNVFNSYTLPAYGSLIYATAKGAFKPSIASAFGYIGSGNLEFHMKLRPNVRFSDGTLMTAKDVVKSIEYFRSADGPESSTLSSISSITTVGASGIRIKLSAPNPLLPLLFSQDYTSGEIIEPKAIAKPSLMSDATFGAGPYELVPGATVINDHYTYVPNPHYFNKAALYWKKIVIKGISNPTSRYAALTSGQAQVAYGDPTTAQAAQKAGYFVSYRPIATQALFLFDRKGKLAPPLAKVQVRQALNYAIDRPAITAATFGKYGLPTDEMALQGSALYDSAAAKYYTYDPAKARSLLAAAGYKHGFTLQVLSTPGLNDLVSEALAGEFQAIGVTLKIDSEQPSAATSDEFAGKFAAVSSAYGDYTAWFSSELLLEPTGVLNPFHTDDPIFVSDIVKLERARLGSAQADAISHQIEDRVVTHAWFVPIFNESEIWYANKGVNGVGLDFLGTSDVLAYRPAR